MGKKGSKRKTRWRTLSIGAPPGEEDEEDGLRNGYVKGQQNDSSPHGFDRNGQGEYKPRRSTIGSSGSSGYTNGTSKARRDESAGSPSQPKIIFNEDEYTRITTPRQDVLFKKGYLSRKKPWAGNASTSATPSTTESQSASHSTADGSETTEDQQLLDRDSATGEYPPGVDPGAQVGYGTFYDHASGYYYEYPVMLVGPTPIPTQIGPNVLAALPCSSVPLRPIEWINPAFVPKLSGQSYCLMNNEVHYQSGQNAETQPMMAEEHGNALVPAENSNGAWNESGIGSTSCNGSVVEETEEQQLEDTNVTKEATAASEDNPTEELFQGVDQVPTIEEIDGNGAPYLEPIVMPQPAAIHVPHVIPAVPQPYMYPGHYMFGPPLVNVNGVTIQGGPMIRTTDITTMTAAAYTKRRKKKRRKQRRAVLGNAEDDEEDYSSDGESGISSSRTSWSTCPSLSTTVTITTTTTAAGTTTTTTPTTMTTMTNRPLNPECEEFHLRPAIERDLSVAVNSSATSEESLNNEEEISSNIGDNCESKYNNNPCEDTTSTEQETKVKENCGPIVESTTSQEVIDSSTNAENRLINYLSGDNEMVSSTKETTDYVINDARTESNEASQRTDINNVADSSFSANEICERPASDINNFPTKLHVDRDKETLSNGQVRSNRPDDDDAEAIQLSSNPIESIAIMENGGLSETPRSSRSSSSQLANENTILGNNIDTRQVQDSSDSSSARGSTRKKYNAKTSRFIREPTPGLNLSDECDTTENVENVAQAVISSQLESVALVVKDTEKEDRVSSESASETGKDNVDNKTANEDVAEGSNDSGFETQTRQPEYRITEAVTEWLRRANSPDVFITATMESDSSDTEDEDLNDKPPKNLQGNPMPALSVNSMADDCTSSCTASCSEFAKINNVDKDRQAYNNKNDNQSAVVTLRKTYVRGSKRRSADRFARQAEDNHDEHTENGVLSSSDSCHQQESNASTTTLRKRNLLRKDVAGVCEFTEKDSVAGMRVATSSRINSKRNTSRRTRRSDKSSKKPAESLDVKIRRINEPLGNEDEGIADDANHTMSVRTFEKGEIVVSVDGKILQISPFAKLLHYVENNVSKNAKKVEEINLEKKISESSEETATERIEMKRRSSDEEDEIDNKMTASLVSIEEPDVLECWEAETIEPIRTPKRMLQSHGVSYEGEAAEEDNFQTEPAIVEHVQKYYRLARESATSIEDELYESKINVLLDTKPFNKSRMVPNSPVELIRGFQGEEIPVIMPNEKDGSLEERKIPVDEAFEVYESCYANKAQTLTLGSIFKTRPLHRQEGEGPVPCRAVCCSIQ
ncbi:hypothetical protein KPH14_001593 [Odynerus spinipes]|uniref:Uncharacterized protein n=1 Tax=Odynerus spinipes TaxID=1348599 RepID=A0AAD9RZB9_9HYME|nr:hypothetical protein KPH14_001593 [Odynerus spinipes]